MKNSLNILLESTSKLSLVILISVGIYSCSGSATSGSEQSISGDEIKLEKLIEKMDIPMDTSGVINKSAPTNVMPTTREELENMKVVMKQFNGKDNAGISVPGFGGLKLGRNESSVSAYYIEYKSVISGNDTSVYGVGYSVHYLFQKVSSGVDVTNLPSIAASVQLESSRTKVRYSIQSYGIFGTSLVRYFKPVINENFDVNGFAVIQTAVNGIHNILGDTALQKTVKFTPQLFKQIRPGDLQN